MVPTRHFSTLGTGGVQYKGCGHPDPGHGWESGRAQLNGGFMAEGADTDEFALTYYNQGELGFIHEAARSTRCTTASSARSSPRLAEQVLQVVRAVGQPQGQHAAVRTGGNQWETIFDRAIGRGLSARYYNSDLPFAAVWGPRGAGWTNPIARYYEDCTAGT